MPAQQRLHVDSASAGYRFEMRDRFAATNDRVMLAAVFNTIEQLREVTSCIGCGDIGHVIRLSDSLSDGKPSATPITGYEPITSATENGPDRHVERYLRRSGVTTDCGRPFCPLRSPQRVEPTRRGRPS